MESIGRWGSLLRHPDEENKIGVPETYPPKYCNPYLGYPKKDTLNPKA